MREKRFARGCIIIFLTIGILALLFADYTTKLTDILRESAAQCEENDNVCFDNLKKNIIFSKDAKIAMAYTGALTLVTLIACVYLLNRFCEKKEEIIVPSEEQNGEIKKAVKKINKKWKKKK